MAELFVDYKPGRDLIVVEYKNEPDANTDWKPLVTLTPIEAMQLAHVLRGKAEILLYRGLPMKILNAVTGREI